MAGAKRGGGGGREKGKREGSACSKSLFFCIINAYQFSSNPITLTVNQVSLHSPLQKNITLTDLRNSLSYSDPEGTLEKIGTLIQP